MHNEYTAILQPPQDDDPWWVASCPEVPGANGQGKTQEACLENLSQAIELMLEVQREEAFRDLPENATTHRVRVA